MKRIFSKKIVVIGMAVLIILALVFFLKNGDGKNIATVTRADIIQEVAATGKVKPNQSVNLGFDKTGRVANVSAYVGQEVKEGEALVSLEAGDIMADLSKARASLQEEMLKLKNTENTAPISYNSAYKNLEAAVKESFADADNAVRNRVDQFFKTPITNPQFEISIISGNFVHYFNVPSEIKIDINNDREKIETILVEWQKRVANISQTNILAESDKAINDLNVISVFLDKIAAAVNTFSPADYAYETTVSNYKTTISSARGEVSTAVSSIVTAKDKFTAAPTIGEGGQFETVLTQQTKVKQAEAAVSSLEASLAKSTIKAPFDGIVTLQEAKVGQTVSPGVSVISINSREEKYVEANISEINIGKISAGNEATIDFDAFPGEKFYGQVSYVEPGDFLVDGVVNYKIRVNLQNSDNRIKNGLTANLRIQTAKKEKALVLPRYAILEENGQKFVNKIDNKNLQKTHVILGIIGNNGDVEITNGLDEGETVQY
jgi:multidrug efflux pump subunit AcrA (membrane-fusion protein)